MVEEQWVVSFLTRFVNKYASKLRSRDRKAPETFSFISTLGIQIRSIDKEERWWSKRSSTTSGHIGIRFSLHLERKAADQHLSARNFWHSLHCPVLMMRLRLCPFTLPVILSKVFFHRGFRLRVTRAKPSVQECSAA